MTKSAINLEATENREPFDDYDELRAAGDVVRDEATGAWIATSYEACREVCRRDRSSVRHPDALGGEFSEISGDRRDLRTLEGEEHRAMHAWMARAFTPSKAAEIQAAIVSEVVSSALNDLADRRSAELTADYLDHIPPRAIAAVLELPWQDAAWMDRAAGAIRSIFKWFNMRGFTTPEMVEEAGAAYGAMREILDPFIVERQSGDRDDLISKLWRDGPTMLDNWGIEDVYSQILTVFLGGWDTTTRALSSTFYMLLTDERLKAEIAGADDARLQAFVDHSLRLYSPVQYRVRVALEDFELGGERISKGDNIIVLIAAANRDGSHYACPHTLDLDGTDQPRDHLTFFAGPGSCAGQGLARAEIFETVRQTLARLPDLRLDPDAPPPEFQGLVLRGYKPLHVLLGPAQATGAEAS